MGLAFLGFWGFWGLGLRYQGSGVRVRKASQLIVTQAETPSSIHKPSRQHVQLLRACSQTKPALS